MLRARGPPRHPYRKVRVELRRCRGWGASTRSEAPWPLSAIKRCRHSRQQLVVSIWQLVVHLRRPRGVGLGCAVLWHAPDDGKHWRADPADALVPVVEAPDFKAHDGIHVGVRLHQAIVVT